MIAGLSVDLVHRPARRHEGCETAWAQPLDRAGDEVIMQGQAQLSRWIVREDGAIGERRVAYGEVEQFRQFRLRKILVANAGVRVEEFGDPGGRWVHFDAGQRQLASEGFRAKGEEEARAATRLEDAPAVEAHPAERPPDRADHELGRVVGVLGRPLEVGEVVARDEPFELDAEIFPGGSKAFAGATEDSIGEVRRAECGEARQLLLLVGARVTAFGLDGGRESDRGEIVLCARLPTLGKAAIAGEPVILRGDGRCGILSREGRGRFGNGRLEQSGALVGRRWLRATLRRGGSVVKAETAAEAGRVEEGQRELIVVHWEAPCLEVGEQARAKAVKPLRETHPSAN